MKEKYIAKSKTAQTMELDSSNTPWLRDDYQMTIAHFPDHGRPFFLGSTIKSNNSLLELARGLSPDESRKINDRIRSEAERILEGGMSKKSDVSVLSSKLKNAPDIYIAAIGEEFKPTGLRLYYSRGEFMGAPALYTHAVARSKDSRKVEKIFEAVGYKTEWYKRPLH